MPPTKDACITKIGGHKLKEVLNSYGVTIKRALFGHHQLRCWVYFSFFFFELFQRWMELFLRSTPLLTLPPFTSEGNKNKPGKIFPLFLQHLLKHCEKKLQ